MENQELQLNQKWKPGIQIDSTCGSFPKPSKKDLAEGEVLIAEQADQRSEPRAHSSEPADSHSYVLLNFLI